MSILTANLKHLYQRRGLWLVYAFLGFFVFMSVLVPLDRPRVGKGQYIGLVVLAFLIGLLAAVLPVEVLTKPFSYCLPGHRKVPRRFIFWVGVVVNLFGSLLFIMYPDLHSGQLVLVVCSAFFAGLIFFWLGVSFAFIVRNSGVWIGFLLLVILGGGFFGLHKVLESVIVGIPFGVILVGILSSVVAWIWLGDERWARKYCAVPWIGFFDAWNRDKMRRYVQVRAAVKWDRLKHHPSPWMETFFLGRMNRHGYFSTGRYIWGGLYTAFGIALSPWKAAFSGVFLVLVIVCFLGYMYPGTDILFIMPVFMIAQMRLPVYSSMLISGGRKERCRCAMTLVITTALLITVLVTIIAALSQPLAAIMPDITLRGRTFTFHAMNIQLFFVPLLAIPIVLAVQLIFYRRPIFIMLSIMLVFGLLFTTVIIWREQLSEVISPMYIVGPVVLSWLLFLLVLRYVCMRRCLVGQGRTY